MPPLLPPMFYCGEIISTLKLNFFRRLRRINSHLKFDFHLQNVRSQNFYFLSTIKKLGLQSTFFGLRKIGSNELRDLESV